MNRFANLPSEYLEVPQSTIRGIARYVEHGIPPGGFLTAVLENNLKESFARADEYNRRAMFDIVMLLYNYAPSNCWGSPERVAAWMLTFETEGADDGKQ